MKDIRWGIIGVGNVTERKSGPAFYKIGHSSLVAVMRRDEAKAKDFAKRHNVEKYYTNADDLIDDREVDAIYVATPPSSHKEYTIKALQAGKPVYVEKPMAMDYSECLEMIEAAKEAGMKLFVAYYRRALPYFQKVKELLDSGAIGKVTTVDIKLIRAAGEADKDINTQPWRVKKEIAGDGYFFDLAPHTLDILDFLLGEIEDAKGYAENIGGYYSVSDTISAILKFKSGAIGTGLWSFISPKEAEQDTVTLTGDKGCLKFNTFSFQPIALIAGDRVEYYETEQPEHIQQPLIQSIVDELRGVGSCPSTGISGARTSHIMDLITKKG
ncbi:Gfo/Idh/MocA family protein [Dysgonomonas sp. 511]|uniref:Gfo/Idh/MocA family protein n=1 Tax=Dysgonomonas sp. 511 TaxID=2302930 RepID=UPI0013D10798|nr:Gfo/Idh/MocA family oxidoreductase [Dysgonomonas sp. 511]NDV79032.1 gfo/Idh/MocA family oxidoreductase [Dysgonomonas sp. 511]